MKKINNLNVKKEHNVLIRNLIIGIILIIVSIVMFMSSYQVSLLEDENMTDLDSIIVSEEESTSKVDKKAYIDVKASPYRFAVYDDTTDAYYIISDGTYLYIAYMSQSDYMKLSEEDTYESPIRITGYTKLSTKEIKELAIDAYNYSMENEEDMLTIADFESYFGEVYLDMTLSDSSNISALIVIGYIISIAGLIISLISIIRLYKFNKSIKKLDDDKIEELDKEMEDPNAFYYEKAHLYLTQKYIINFGGKFNIIEYKDILWIYPFIQRVNGIKASQCLMVLTNDAKTHRIAEIDIITKKKKEVYEEIWNTIISKNPKMLTGYTKENIAIMNDKVKEIKEEKKNNK